MTADKKCRVVNVQRLTPESYEKPVSSIKSSWRIVVVVVVAQRLDTLGRSNIFSQHMSKVGCLQSPRIPATVGKNS
ncbi:hypothetical protein ElyMa_002057600 [Elysia marginata]|uniref:Uncharacterized protein n=1 Tax=Elysia marginata TaxID=1093978 RepID=A0AAV4F9K8_9GAST|nr:hypothetical protein ElyMa_002057600 [Elysia marginata]